MNDEALIAYGQQTSEIAERLMKDDPNIPFVTATIIAGDLMSADRATSELNAGVPFDRAVWMVGSYARWDWALQMLAQGAVSEEDFAAMICRLWSASDPDDTKTDNLRVWQRVFASTGGVIRDGRPLPNQKPLVVFRVITQEDELAGIAWTTDPKIAAKFAAGAGLRIKTDGRVLRGTCDPHHVLAYITGRGESEVIIDPRLIKDIQIVGVGRR